MNSNATEVLNSKNADEIRNGFVMAFLILEEYTGRSEWYNSERFLTTPRNVHLNTIGGQTLLPLPEWQALPGRDMID